MLITYAVMSDYKGLETHVEGFYSSQKKAQAKIDSLPEKRCFVQPWMMDGEPAFWFVSMSVDGKYHISPSDLDTGDYVEGEPKFQETIIRNSAIGLHLGFF